MRQLLVTLTLIVAIMAPYEMSWGVPIGSKPQSTKKLKRSQAKKIKTMATKKAKKAALVKAHPLLKKKNLAPRQVLQKPIQAHTSPPAQSAQISTADLPESAPPQKMPRYAGQSVGGSLPGAMENRIQSKKKAWSISASLGHSESMYKTDEASNSQSNDYSLGGSYSFAEIYGVSASVNYSQDLNAQEADYGRAGLKFKRKGISVLQKRMSISPSIGFGIPISKRARDASLQGSLTIGSSFNANSDYLFSKSLGIGLNLAFTRNFHQFETAEYSGRVNTQYSSIQGLVFSWNFTDKLEFSVSGDHVDTVSYQGGNRDYYGHTESLSLQVSDNFGLGLGHTISQAPTRKANGEDLNINVTNEQDSIFYGELSFNY